MSIHRFVRFYLAFLAVAVVLSAWCPPTAKAVSSATSFRDIDPVELKMTSEPAAPGASAIILYPEVYRDDSGHTPHEDDYYRIKILTEEGRKYGDIEIPFLAGTASITGTHARTISPDGSV